MRAQILSTCVAALLAGAFICCGKDGASIKIGGLLPVTGEASPFGAGSRKGHDLAVKEWNERGGVLGRPLELLILDDQGLHGLTRLIEHDQVVALLGANISKVSLAAAPIAQAAGVPMVSPLASHPKLTAIGDCIYRVCFTDRDQGAAGAVFAFHDLKPGRRPASSTGATRSPRRSHGSSGTSSPHWAARSPRSSQLVSNILGAGRHRPNPAWTPVGLEGRARGPHRRRGSGVHAGEATCGAVQRKSLIFRAGRADATVELA